MAEVYAGRKFRTVFRGYALVADTRIPGLIACGRRFAEVGLANSNDGYLALRHASGMLIKTGGASIGSLAAQTFALVHGHDPSRNLVVASGPAEPSSESQMAWLIFQDRPDVGAIVHVHAPSPPTPDDRSSLPRSMNVTEREAEYGTMALAHQTLLGLLDAHTVWLRGHGYVTIGADLAEAEHRLLTHLHTLHPERFPAARATTDPVLP